MQYDDAEEIPANPFPLEAVATYGNIVRSCDELLFMDLPLKELNGYLESYPHANSRYGAAIGLRGGHGSGKTHLLIRLSEKAKEFQRIHPLVLYAKADKANFYDLYFQLMSGLPREPLQHYLSLAMTSIAIKHVQHAKATESISERITGPEDLPKLYDEGNLARDQLLTTLQKRLEDTQVPVEIPRVLMQIDNPTYGDKAYQWLLGNEITKPEELGLSRSLLRLERARGDGNDVALDTAAPDVTAVDALETISVLLNLAECPLIVLIDQLEVLFRVEDKDRRETLFSVIKKLIEQLKGHNVLMFIAGNDEAWDLLPRDVTPRLRQREAVPVGNLTPAETASLLDSYTSAAKGVTHFSVTNAGIINELSGGSPREIIRIAHHAFNKANGALKEVDETLLIKCARKSGSIADRTRLALQQAELVLRPFGMLLQDLEVENGVLIDYLLMVDRMPLLGLVTAKATDKLAEVDSARRIQYASNYLREKYPTAQLFVVSVGYSSHEVRKLLSTTSTVLQYNERQFAQQLTAKVAEIVAQGHPVPGDGAIANTVILEAVNKIVSRLDQLEVERSKEVDEVAEQFSDRARDLHGAVREEREMRTRWEVRDALDSLQEVLLSGWASWSRPLRRQRWEEERQRIKSILVASEANLRIRDFDYVGGLYQDLLMEERSFWKELDKLEAEQQRAGNFDPSFPESGNLYRYHRETDPRWILSEILQFRRYLINRMRHLLQGPGLFDKWIEKPWHYSIIPTSVFTFIWLWFLVEESWFAAHEIERIGLWGFMFLRVFSVVVVAYGMTTISLFLMGRMRAQALEREAWRIKQLIRNYEKKK